MDGESRPRTQAPDTDRASILAELADTRSEPAPAAEEKPVEAAPAAKPAEPAPEPEPDDDDADEADDDETEADDELDDEDDAAAADSDTQRRLAIVQRADRRRREAFAAREQAFEEKQSRWGEENRATVDKATRYDGIGPRFVTDPVGVAMELDVPEDQYEYIAEQFFRLSKKAQEDPRHREAARIARLERQIAERDRREKEQTTKAEEQRKAQEVTEAAKREGAAYLDKLTKRVTGTAVAKLATGAPDLLRRQLGQLALEMMGDTAKFPPTKKVVAEYEKRKRAEYAAMGFTVGEGVAADKAATTSTDKAAPAAKPGAAAPATPAEEKPAARLRGKDAERRAILGEIRAARANASE